MDPPKKAGFPDHAIEASKCLTFLSEYDVDEFDPAAGKKYLLKLQDVANRQSHALNVELDDVTDWAEGQGDPSFVGAILQNTRRYVEHFYNAAEQLLPQPTVAITQDAKDVFLDHRKQQLKTMKDSDDISSAIPFELIRRFELRLVPRSTDKASYLRDIKAAQVGTLISVRGIVTRVTDVQPVMQVASYLCDVCGFESYQTVAARREYTPLAKCPSPACSQNNVQGKLFAQTRGSKLEKYQELRLQELPEEVPVGHIPRSLACKAFGELTRKCVPGDIVTICGIFLPSPFQGFRAIRAGLTAETFVEIQQLFNNKKTVEVATDPKLDAEILEKSRDEDIYENLAASIAPEIFGQEDIKKALMLLLVSGVTRKMSDGMRIRGDINILMMGDPGTAKSQLLKHITRVAPRSVYTTGKGSSGVGLTAAVTRDPATGEMALEGGALVLADKGICCIDEFDKMEDGDKTAIHEVMEQQSVSIAKAGITTTLNARTAVLAAANPVYGRWDKRRSPEANLGMETALLSRFDLTFIILDIPSPERDEALAAHVTHVHRENKHPPLMFEPFSENFMRAYVAKAKTIDPFLPEELASYIASSFVQMRAESAEEVSGWSGNAEANQRQRFCTARSLISIIRLAQALARIKFQEEVSKDDVEEAMRLLYVSKAMEEDEEDKREKEDPTTEIYSIIRRHAKSRRTLELPTADVLAEIVRKGYSEEALESTLDMYQDLGVWTVSRGRKIVRFIPGQE